MINLYPHQTDALNDTKKLDHVAYFHDMGLGKTYTGAEKLWQLSAQTNIIVCQKSKVEDWFEHINNNYILPVYDLTNKHHYSQFIKNPVGVGIINYELIWRRKELANLHGITLMLDESSNIQHDTSKKTKFIMKMQADNVILLSGSPSAGHYENLYTQLKLLGLPQTKTAFWNTYVNYIVDRSQGFPLTKIFGYKNVAQLKTIMHDLGCRFLKTEDVLDLPEQTFTKTFVDVTPQYKKFAKDRIIEIDGEELVGDTSLKMLLYSRQLCGAYNKDKLQAVADILESTDDGIVIFYSFDAELHALKEICKSRPISEVNGHTRNLSAFEANNNAVVLVQYQAGAQGLNLQKYNKMIYFTPPLSCEHWMQSKKRIHRIGTTDPCFYYQLICKNSVEGKIYDRLEQGQDYTLRLFEKEDL